MMEEQPGERKQRQRREHPCKLRQIAVKFDRVE